MLKWGLRKEWGVRKWGDDELDGLAKEIFGLLKTKINICHATL
jgi:hypothetical protein